jgi:hypothetical protein
MVVLGTVAPVGSVTVPVIVAKVVWALREKQLEARHASEINILKKDMNFFLRPIAQSDAGTIADDAIKLEY